MIVGSIWYAANFRWVSRYIRYSWKIVAGTLSRSDSPLAKRFFTFG